MIQRGKAIISILLIASIFLSSCATINNTMDNMGQNEKIGTMSGAVTGAAIGGWLGNHFGGDAGTIAGILIGGSIGGYFGNQIGASFDERDKRLTQIKANSGINIQRSTYSTLSKSEESNFKSKLKHMSEKDKKKSYQSRAIYKTIAPSQFKPGSSKLSPKMKAFFTEIAKAYKADGIRKVMIVGHADSQGDARMNQKLSEQRAKAVAQVFMKVGYPSSGIYYQGAGESEPIADNSSPTGRAENRRVEIIDAETTQGLAMAKRYSIAESHAVMKKIKPKQSKSSKPSTTIAKNLAGTDCILPFHGDLYNGQQLLTSGHKAKDIENKTSLLDDLTSALDKATGAFVRAAYAAGKQTIPLFLDDDLAIAGPFKRLDGKTRNLFVPSDHMPAYYNQPIYTYLDGDAFFSLQPISVLKEEALAIPTPSMIVYKRYDGKGDKADANLRGMAQLYVNGDIMLYRWKANDSGVKKIGVLGLDVVLPKFDEEAFRKTHTEYLIAQVYYLKHGNVMVDRIKLKLRLNQKSKINWRL